jgi:hypothetical protein
MSSSAHDCDPATASFSHVLSASHRIDRFLLGQPVFAFQRIDLAVGAGGLVKSDADPVELLPKLTAPGPL